MYDGYILCLSSNFLQQKQRFLALLGGEKSESPLIPGSLYTSFNEGGSAMNHGRFWSAASLSSLAARMFGQIYNG